MGRKLTESMELAGQCCLSWLDREKDCMPTGGYEVAHDTGRWWDAVLRLEAATGFVIPAEIEGAMLRNLHALTDNPDGLLMNNPEVPWLEAMINPHNFREGMLAFHALVRYRGSAWAREAGHRLLETMDKCFQPDGRFDYSLLECHGKIPLSTDPCHDQDEGAWFDSTANSGRSLEAILWFHEATGDPLALSLADRIARHHLEHTLNRDGSARAEIIDPANVGHNHSYLGTLRGLLLFGLATGQPEYVDAVSATYRHSLWKHNVSESGWAPHDLGKTRFPDAHGDPVPETASCGDVAQLALWLALRTGRPELLDDVERLVRARVLPAQITEADGGDAEITPKMLGAWGASGTPYGKGSIIDVVAAVLHTEVDVYEHVVTRGPLGLMVNLHFDRSGPELEVRRDRGECATVRCRPWVRESVLLRLPAWTPPSSVCLTVAGRPHPVRRIGNYACVAKDDLTPGCEIVLTFDLPERTTCETTPSGRDFSLRWRGDEVVGISPHEPPMSMHPPMEDGGR